VNVGKKWVVNGAINRMEIGRELLKGRKLGKSLRKIRMREEKRVR